MELPTEPGPGRTDRPAPEPAASLRQRWRLVVSRAADAPRLGGRELVDAWETAMEASGLPVHRPVGRSRTRVAFAAPLPAGIAAERELLEIHLAERRPVWEVREALVDRLPIGWRLIDLYDVWTGAPALAGRVTAFEYRAELAAPIDLDAVEAAARELRAARTLPRWRTKGGVEIGYDLRPLLEDVSAGEASGRPIVRIRTRVHPELGTGRPEEVLAALGDRLGHPLEPATIVRERLVLADDAG